MFTIDRSNICGIVSVDSSVYYNYMCNIARIHVTHVRVVYFFNRVMTNNQSLQLVAKYNHYPLNCQKHNTISSANLTHYRYVAAGYDVPVVVTIITAVTPGG